MTARPTPVPATPTQLALRQNRKISGRSSAACPRSRQARDYFSRARRSHQSTSRCQVNGSGTEEVVPAGQPRRTAGAGEACPPVHLCGRVVARSSGSARPPEDRSVAARARRAPDVTHPRTAGTPHQVWSCEHAAGRRCQCPRPRETSDDRSGKRQLQDHERTAVTITAQTSSPERDTPSRPPLCARAVGLAGPSRGHLGH